MTNESEIVRQLKDKFSSINSTGEKLTILNVLLKAGHCKQVVLNGLARLVTCPFRRKVWYEKRVFYQPQTGMWKELPICVVDSVITFYESDKITYGCSLICTKTSEGPR